MGLYINDVRLPFFEAILLSNCGTSYELFPWGSLDLAFSQRNLLGTASQSTQRPSLV